MFGVLVTIGHQQHQYDEEYSDEQSCIHSC